MWTQPRGASSPPRRPRSPSPSFGAFIHPFFLTKVEKAPRKRYNLGDERRDAEVGGDGSPSGTEMPSTRQMGPTSASRRRINSVPAVREGHPLLGGRARVTNGFI